jgi:hypothetical protein
LLNVVHRGCTGSCEQVRNAVHAATVTATVATTNTTAVVATCIVTAIAIINAVEIAFANAIATAAATAAALLWLASTAIRSGHASMERKVHLTKKKVRRKGGAGEYHETVTHHTKRRHIKNKALAHQPWRNKEPPPAVRARRH